MKLSDYFTEDELEQYDDIIEHYGTLGITRQAYEELCEGLGRKMFKLATMKRDGNKTLQEYLDSLD